MSLTDKELQNKRVQLAFLSCRFILLFNPLFLRVWVHSNTVDPSPNWYSISAVLSRLSVIKIFTKEVFYQTNYSVTRSSSFVSSCVVVSALQSLCPAALHSLPVNSLLFSWQRNALSSVESLTARITQQINGGFRVRRPNRQLVKLSVWRLNTLKETRWTFH